jgi:hypothetical protein
MLSAAFFVILSLGVLCAAQPVGLPAQDTRSYGVANCRIEKPVMWNPPAASWLGSCKAGHADGWGALQDSPGGPAFVGLVSEGYLRSGVFVAEGRYTAGRWKDGAVVHDETVDRNTAIQAFNDAAKAAQAASNSMAKVSNRKASRFYARLAKSLLNQME